MSAAPVVDASRHPLMTGSPPDCADEWGEDRFGVFIAFTLDEVAQRLRWIPPGRFLMGSPPQETQGLAREDAERTWFEREHPRHQVTLTKGFWLFDTPCTQALWSAVMGSNPSRFKSADRPVEQVSWDDAQGFVARINARVPGLGLALPTEAQWEHACRAGTGTALYTGPIRILGANHAPELDAIAWYTGNSGVGFELADGYDASAGPERQYSDAKSGTHPVCRKKPNPWGLYDMIGNVWEWCADGPRKYGADPVADPMGGPEPGAGRVIRGGSWGDEARFGRCAFRYQNAPDNRLDDLGFRCARVQES